uniref:Protein kinase putative n=1 Tax=Albugo laibachii Nc14 TaxID=890382 RepID=F0WTH5_9STRA|nr:protein kinase putative [Albugo laibachii Nc14]|eukprot:CCA24665.1 protein kinase putative [Albugo laibachii Nc14]
MGAAQSWCCGDNVPDYELLFPLNNKQLKQNKLLINGSTNGDGQEIKKARAQAILMQEPSYSDGTLEYKYEMISEIGHGSTSIVYRCKERHTERLYACKIIDRRVLQDRRDDFLEQFQIEIQVLQSMRHPNIIHIEDVYLTDSKICMVTEYMDGGELFDYIVDKGSLSEVEASNLVRKITSAVAYMHACGVVHRDLKPENLMLTSTKPGAEVKIIDFGLAKLLDENAVTTSFLGTKGYLAPEMLQRQAYTMTVDIWALGVIVYVLLCGCLPFNDDGARISNLKAARVKFGLRFPRWASDLSESAKDLLRHLLEVDCSKRYTAEQALAHPWVTGQQTPNHLLRSPNYLKRIKEGQKQRQTPPTQDSIAQKFERRQSR